MYKIINETINSVIGNDSHTPFIPRSEANNKVIGIIKISPRSIEIIKESLGLSIELK